MDIILYEEIKEINSGVPLSFNIQEKDLIITVSKATSVKYNMIIGQRISFYKNSYSKNVYVMGRIESGEMLDENHITYTITYLHEFHKYVHGQMRMSHISTPPYSEYIEKYDANNGTWDYLDHEDREDLVRVWNEKLGVKE